MNLSGWIDPRVEQVSAAGAEAYMLSHGWCRVPYPRPQLLVFGGVRDDDGQEITLTLPSSEQMRDYRLGVVRLISALSVYEDRPAVDILNDMLAAHAKDPPGQNGANSPAESVKRE
jgi:hypothetical protein